MPWNQQDLDRIERALASGALSVEFHDRVVRYRSVDELTKVRDMVKKRLDTGSTESKNRTRLHVSKGW
jgi:hypothetical protein